MGGIVFDVSWDTSEIERGLIEYRSRVLIAIHEIATYFQPILEGFAKEHATWKDRTSNARQSLEAFTEDLAEEVVALYLAHGMDYGIYLEVRFQGRYAIIWPTIQAHLPDIRRVIQRVFS